MTRDKKGDSPQSAASSAKGSESLAKRATVQIVLPSPRKKTSDASRATTRRITTKVSVRDTLVVVDGGPRFRLKRQIAEGGMGVVYEAEDLQCQRCVALKLLPRQKKVSPEDRVQFVREARITAGLEHPNIIPVHEVGRDVHGNVYYVMKYIEGRTLTDILMAIRRGNPETISAYPLSKLLNIFLKVCDAVTYAHAHGILHCDLKPDNVMVCDFGEVVLTDWGLARRLSSERSLPARGHPTKVITQDSILREIASEGTSPEEVGIRTSTGSVMGTPGFMAPERLLDDQHIDFRSDVYSLGAILYSILALRAPVTGTDLQGVLRSILSGQITPPVMLNDPVVREKLAPYWGNFGFPHCPDRRIPEPLSDVAMKALATNPDERYPTVRELQEDVETYLAGRSWYTVVDERFTDRASFESRWEVVGGSWEWRPGELRIHGGEPQLLIFKKDLPGDVRIEFEAFQRSAYLNDISCFVSAVRIENRKELPYTGYEFKYGGFDNSMNLLVRADRRLWTEAASPLERGKLYRVVAERSGNRFRMLVNQRVVFDVIDPEPLSGGEHCVVGLFGWIADTVYKRVRIQYRGVAGSGDILDFADRQVQRGNYEIAEALYQEVLETFADSARAERARKGIEASRRSRLLRARLDDILSQLRKAWPHTPVNVTMTPEGFVVDIADGDVDDLEPLRGLQIVALHCQNNRIRSLEPLRGIPLGTLNCSGNPIEDLSPLAGMPLRTLLCERCRISSLEPLRGMPLNSLFVGGNPVSTLEPLRGMPLTTLNMWGLQVHALDPLRGMPLSSLTANVNRIGSLEPLRDMKLVMLNVAGNEMIEDLSPLQGMPLKVLHVGRNRISSLRPLEGMALNMLTCAGNRISDLRPLVGMPLHVLTCSNNLLRRVVPFTHHPPEDFLFDCDSIDDMELEHLVLVWGRRPQTAHLAHQVEVLLAIRRGERKTLRRFARKFRDSYFLFVPKFLTWDKAVAFCAEAGGRLAEVPDAHTQALLETMFRVGCWAWFGLEVTEDGPRWLSGQPVKYQNFADTAHMRQLGKKVFARQWMSEHDPRAENPFILEWPA